MALLLLVLLYYHVDCLVLLVPMACLAPSFAPLPPPSLPDLSPIWLSFSTVNWQRKKGAGNSSPSVSRSYILLCSCLERLATKAIVTSDDAFVVDSHFKKSVSNMFYHFWASNQFWKGNCTILLFSVTRGVSPFFYIIRHLDTFSRLEDGGSSFPRNVATLVPNYNWPVFIFISVRNCHHVQSCAA